MYGDCTELNRSQKPSVSHIFCLQQIPENYFALHEMPQNGPLKSQKLKIWFYPGNADDNN